MKLTFLGATETVTGSKFLVETAGKRFLVDCGLFQGFKELRLRNREPFPIDPKTIDAVLLTHAHIDHSGYLPLLVKLGFSGKIYSTHATRDLCEILLLDAGRLQEEDARRAGRYGYSKHKPPLPLFTEDDAKRSLKHFECIRFEKVQQLAKGVTISFSRSGHILGSSFITFVSEDKKLVFTGDLGRPHDPVMLPPAKIEFADYLVLESTYGNRRHPDVDVLNSLEEIINSTFAKGGTVVIPAFAVGRTQVILYYINKLKQEHRLASNVPVYLDSPMAQDATTLWCNYMEEHNLTKDESAEVCSLAGYVQSQEASKRLNASSTPAIIISASGMAEGGRVLHHLAHYAPHSENTILFAGFQAAGTRGARLLRGEREIKIFGSLIPIRARIENLDTLSSHADYEETLQWLTGFKSPPKQVFLTHGEPDAAASLKSKIEAKFGWKVTIPHYLDAFDLSSQ